MLSINLKKWQKGGVIGFAIGIIIACFLILSTTFNLGESVWKWLLYLNASLYVICKDITFINLKWFYYGLSGIMIIIYTAFGIIIGKVQQVNRPLTRRLLSVLIALVLIIYFVFNVLLGMWLEQA